MPPTTCRCSTLSPASWRRRPAAAWRPPTCTCGGRLSVRTSVARTHLLDAAERLSAAGLLAVLPPDPRVSAFRRWYLAEIHRQLSDGGARGREQLAVRGPGQQHLSGECLLNRDRGAVGLRRVGQLGDVGAANATCPVSGRRPAAARISPRRTPVHSAVEVARGWPSSWPGTRPARDRPQRPATRLRLPPRAVGATLSNMLEIPWGVGVYKPCHMRLGHGRSP